ncbi:MAG: helix-turn-helix domain-containing protein, partial [Candidatus Berkiella sp.]
KEALDKTNGIVSHAAQKLGMRRTTLIEKMKKFNIAK